MTQLTSPVEQYPGTVTLKPLVMPLFLQWHTAFRQAQGADTNLTAYTEYLPAICDCVERWDLEGFPEHVTPDTYPADNVVQRLAVIVWILGELTARFFGTGEARPNV